MTELDSYKKSSAQLKDTLKREREEGNKLKRKFEHLQREMRTAEAELQALYERDRLRRLHKNTLSKCKNNIKS